MMYVFGKCKKCDTRTVDGICPACFNSQHLRLRLFAKKLLELKMDSGFTVEEKMRHATFKGHPDATELVRQLDLVRYLGENL